MHISHPGAVLTAIVLAFASAACDPPERELPTMPSEVTTKAEGEQPPEPNEKTDDRSTATSSNDKAAKNADLPRGEPPSKDALEKAIEEEHDRAHAALFDTEKCESERLQRCLDLEDAEKWEKAGRCYRRTFDGKLMGDCRSMQFIESAVSYRRAGMKKKELEQWLELVSRADSNVAGVLIADLRLGEGRFDLARAGYALYLDQDEDSTLDDYVKAQCRRLNGCE